MRKLRISANYFGQDRWICQHGYNIFSALNVYPCYSFLESLKQYCCKHDFLAFFVRYIIVKLINLYLCTSSGCLDMHLVCLRLNLEKCCKTNLIKIAKTTTVPFQLTTLMFSNIYIPIVAPNSLWDLNQPNVAKFFLI